MTIRTSRHPINFYLPLLFVTAFLSFAPFAVFKRNNTFSFENLSHKDILILFAFTLIILIILFILFRLYYKYTPLILIDEDFITICKNKFNVTDLKKVHLSQQDSPPYMLRISSESTQLVFNDKSTITLYDPLYRNISMVKSYFEQRVNQKKNKFDVITLNKPSHQLKTTPNDPVFKGNIIFSWLAFTLWIPSSLLFYSIMTHNEDTQDSLTFKIVLFSAWFIYHSRKMNYLTIVDNHLVVKNQLFLRQKSIIPLSNIREIVLEEYQTLRGGLTSTRVRLISKDFANKCFTLGGLSKTDRDRLLKTLKSRNIKHRKEF